MVVEEKIKTFGPDEWHRFLAAIDDFPKLGIYGANNRIRIKGAVLLHRYTGLRISDVVKLKLERIKDGACEVRAAKNGKRVWLPLPPEVLAALQAWVDVRPENWPYYFWSGNGDYDSCVKDLQRSIRKVAERAKVKLHPHMFRHTLGSQLRDEGVSDEVIADILGDDVKTVRKHYFHFTEDSQKNITEALNKIWKK